jgi:hypothetical protein
MLWEGRETAAGAGRKGRKKVWIFFERFGMGRV